MDVLPDFFIAGTVKASTALLVAHMQQHPEIYFSSVKESKYFSVDDNRFPHREAGADLVDSKVVRDLTVYQGLFSSAVVYRTRREPSVDYLYFPGVPARIFRAMGHAVPTPVKRGISRVVGSINLKKMPLLETTRHILRDEYRSDLRRWKAVIQLDLPQWYTDSTQ